MDYMKILRRSWDILWNYRILWVFGLILAITVGGSTFNGGGSGTGYQTNNQEVQRYLPGDWNEYSINSPQEFFQKMEMAGSELGSELKGLVADQPEISTLFGILITALILLVLTGIGMTILRYVTETSVIRMVDEHETSGDKVTIKQGFKLGWSKRSWRLFLLDLLLLFLPGVILLSLLVLIGWTIVTTIIGGQQIMVAGIFLVAGSAFLLILLSGLYFVLIGFLRNFIIRTCVLEDAGIGEAVKQGLALVRTNWKDAGMMWLIMIGLGIAWWIVSIILLFVMIPVILISVVLAALVACLPGLLAGSLSMLFMPATPWAIIVGVIFALPFFILIAAAPLLFVEGLVQIFRSIVWTLVYREFSGEDKSVQVLEPVSED